ncbi:MAG: histidine phosphatase family protein [Alphaproteobacteria bacterium]|nr:histidine phosphatase family protein [Alphaproteobacteria bacterium]
MHQKTLYLLRHGTAANAGDYTEDRLRPLTPQGLADASRVGAYMRARHLMPSLVLCSPSLRTRQTVEAMMEALGFGLTVKNNDTLYLASPTTLLKILSEVPETIDSVMVVAHNPGLHQLALQLATRAEDGLGSALSARFPTAALAEITLPVAQWSQIGTQTGTLTRFAGPSGLEVVSA